MTAFRNLSVSKGVQEGCREGHGRRPLSRCSRASSGPLASGGHWSPGDCLPCVCSRAWDTGSGVAVSLPSPCSLLLLTTSISVQAGSDCHWKELGTQQSSQCGRFWKFHLFDHAVLSSQAQCQEVRKRKELESQILTEAVRNWEGDDIRTLGSVLYLSQVTMQCAGSEVLRPPPRRRPAALCVPSCCLPPTSCALGSRTLFCRALVNACSQSGFPSGAGSVVSLVPCEQLALMGRNPVHVPLNCERSFPCGVSFCLYR